MQPWWTQTPNFSIVIIIYSVFLIKTNLFCYSWQIKSRYCIYTDWCQYTVQEDYHIVQRNISKQNLKQRIWNHALPCVVTSSVSRDVLTASQVSSCTMNSSSFRVASNSILKSGVVWNLWCFIKHFIILKVLPHVKQLKGLSLCKALWMLNRAMSLNDTPQDSQTNGSCLSSAARFVLVEGWLSLKLKLLARISVGADDSWWYGVFAACTDVSRFSDSIS